VADRVPYAVAGAAMRQAIARALTAELGPRQWRVFAVVLDRTVSWSKLDDRLYLAAIAAEVFELDEPTPWQIDKVGRDLSALAGAGVIEREPPKAGRRRAGAAYRVALPLPETRPSADGLEGDKPAHERAETRPRARVYPPAGGRPTEKDSENPSEGDTHAVVVDLFAERRDGDTRRRAQPSCRTCNDNPLAEACPGCGRWGSSS
jgi:hypothetical protein